ncbi:MAG: metal ABC transporter substrate-binding protein [Acidimicrobiales bacterium]
MILNPGGGIVARQRTRWLAALLGATALVGACGQTDSSGDGAQTSDADRPTVVVTTNILGDVVGELVGATAEVVTIMPIGADPHDFQASAQEVNQIQSADVLIVNGADFEETLLDVIESAEADGIPTFEAIAAVEKLEFTEQGHDEDHADEEDHADDEHDHEGADPHFFTDVARMAQAADAIGEFLLANLDGVDTAALQANIDAYVTELTALDTEVAAILDAVPSDRRVLITNHEVFGYFAERYGFDVVGAVIPSGSTADGASAQDLAALAEEIEHEGVAAIFADTSSSNELAQTLAAEVGGDVHVVELFSESLGEPGSGGSTYVEMMRTNAERIVEALG